MKTIDVKEISMYKDGGTTVYKSTKGKLYYKDGRLRTETKGKIYDRYPSDEGAKLLDVKLEIL